MVGVDDYGRSYLEKLADSTIVKVYRNEVAIPYQGKSREWLIDSICERRRQEKMTKGDYKTKFENARGELNRQRKRIDELTLKLARCEVERRHAVEVRDVLLAKLDGEE